MSKESEIEGTGDRARRWHHFRPTPRRRSDLMGFNSTWWMVLAWEIRICPDSADARLVKKPAQVVSDVHVVLT